MEDKARRTGAALHCRRQTRPGQLCGWCVEDGLHSELER